MMTRHVLRQAHEKDDESDDEYRSDTDVHKNLRFTSECSLEHKCMRWSGRYRTYPEFSRKACLVWRRRGL